MKRNEPHNLDDALRWALRQQAQTTPLSDVQLEQMKRRIRQKEEPNMKRFSMKKGLLVACALCVVGSITAVAAGKLAAVEVHSSLEDIMTSYEELETASKELFDVSLPETFDNGYTFANAVPGAATGADENGNALSQWETLMVTYTKDDAAELNLAVDPLMAGTAVETGTASTIDGITYYYNEVTYLTLPPEEKPTAQEEALAEEGKLAIAYGSATRQESQLEQVSWQQDGMACQMFLMDGNLGEDELLEMAQETAEHMAAE